ncbi:Os06g0689366 [Oryza sativa Japonica Group]|uniref:Os06g0689366 protein n=1 Tax=Oryza sativa subsp. japonica TaxID=39947 RepID=A0A0P0X0I4_ORYSJ|nr:Os06g0689366 [Oryza sativa Japonica Group]
MVVKEKALEVLSATTGRLPPAAGVERGNSSIGGLLRSPAPCRETPERVVVVAALSTLVSAATETIARHCCWRPSKLAHC